MIRNWSNKLAESIYSSSDRAYSVPVLAYGIQIVLSSLIKAALLLFIAWITSTFWTTLIAAFSFSVLRTFSGGVHCTTYGRCLGTSLLFFPFFGWLTIVSYPWYLKNEFVFFSLFFLYSLSVIWIWVPGKWDTKHLTHSDWTFKGRSVLLIFIIFSILYILPIESYTEVPVLLSVIMGWMFQLFTVTPAGYNTIGAIDKRFSKIFERRNIHA
ncbi:accessory gene regulator B family protein [Microaerobacter geothermalis]|uniref:accessory gene regulator ArgB-like protein n=1 Tax=Microaerobacter geothermalis TaxID=674972 RepID=UPI001F1FF4EE|nr:accessory gene regulator B family protein [Microaerobacter geothermalis]MCF6094495.1 accessory gene regulator B family protein [Microaerobacter geothermalis]